MRARSGTWMALALGALVAAGCGGDGAGNGSGGGAGGAGSGPEEWVPLVAFDTIPGMVLANGDTLALTMEVADNGDRRAYGLMERPGLDAGHSMIFVYPSDHPGSSPFWMYRTNMALDIAFLDAGGEIVAILGMDPCRSPNPEVCRRYAPGVDYRGALEVPRGWFEAHGVERGDSVRPAPGELPSVP